MTGTTLNNRALIRLSGEGSEVRDFLQGLLTSDVSGTLPIWAGLLTAQGKALFDFIVWDAADAPGDVLIDCEAAQADALAKRLTLYRLRRKIAIGREDRLAVHWAADGDEGVADPRLPALGRRWIAAAGEAAAGWLEHRLRLGVTEGVAEIGSDRTLWLECNAAELNGVSFTKGCYVGQENTARMNWRSTVNRRLVVVETGEEGPRTRALYAELGLAVEHRRVEAIEGAIMPAWLAAAVAG